MRGMGRTSTERKKVRGHRDTDYAQDNKPCWNVTGVTILIKKTKYLRTCNTARL